MALNSKDRVVTFGANFVKPGMLDVAKAEREACLILDYIEHVPSTEPKILAEEAISAAEGQLNAAYNGYPTGLEFYAKDDGSVVLTHVVQVENEHLLEAFVDAETGGIVAVNDFTAASAVSTLSCCFV